MVYEWAEEGHKHGIPTCCGIRFGIDWERPKLGWYIPLPATRVLVRAACLFPAPRRAFAMHDGQGYVPCEFHLALWLLTGYRPDIRQDDPA